MAYNVLVSAMITRARLYADERPGGSNSFINDTEVLSLAQSEIAELYDLLVAARGHEYYKAENLTATVAGTKTVALPGDFYQLIRLDLEWGAQNVETMVPYEQLEAQDLKNLGSWAQHTPKAYRLQAANIELLPVPTTATAMRIYYVPALDAALTTSSTIDCVNGWDDAVALGIAAKMLLIDARDPSRLLALKERKLEQIREMADDRAAAQPSRVVDVDRGQSWMWPRDYGRPAW